MQVQELKAPLIQEDLFLAVMQFEHGGIFFKAAVTEELTFSGEQTLGFQVLLNSRIGTYSFVVSCYEDEQEQVEEKVNDFYINAAGGMEQLISPTAVRRIPFLAGVISIIRQELIKMGKIE